MPAKKPAYRKVGCAFPRMAGYDQGKAIPNFSIWLTVSINRKHQL